MNTIKEHVNSKTFKIILAIIAGIIVVLLIFQIGVFVGLNKATFSDEFGNNYRNIFMGQGRAPGGMMRGFFAPNDLPTSNGAVGQIVKINLPTFVVLGSDNIEKVILVDSGTLIREFRQDITPSDLKVGDNVVVLGSPNSSSQIVAKLIRIMPDMMQYQENQNGASTTNQ